MNKKTLIKTLFIILNIIVLAIILIHIYIPSDLLYSTKYKLKSDVTMYPANGETDITPINLSPQTGVSNEYTIEKLNLINDTVVISNVYKISPDNPTPVTMQGEVPISINYMMMLHKHIHVSPEKLYIFSKQGYRILYCLIFLAIYAIVTGFVYRVVARRRDK